MYSAAWTSWTLDHMSGKGTKQRANCVACSPWQIKAVQECQRVGEVRLWFGEMLIDHNLGCDFGTLFADRSTFHSRAENNVVMPQRVLSPLENMYQFGIYCLFSGEPWNSLQWWRNVIVNHWSSRCVVGVLVWRVWLRRKSKVNFWICWLLRVS